MSGHRITTRLGSGKVFYHKTGLLRRDVVESPRRNMKTVKWTARLLAMLGKAPDKQIAQLLGAGRTTVATKRAQLGIPTHGCKPVKWTAPIKDKYSKTQILDAIAAATDLSRKQVAAVLDSLGEVIEAHVKKNAVGEFVLPGLLKISTVRKPATKARKGVNPFTKEEVTFKAKPASTVVKLRPLKGLKDMAG